jgi:hypothetical protein
MAGCCDNEGGGGGGGFTEHTDNVKAGNCSIIQKGVSPCTLSH